MPYLQKERNTSLFPFSPARILSDILTCLIHFFCRHTRFLRMISSIFFCSLNTHDLESSQEETSNCGFTRRIYFVASLPHDKIESIISDIGTNETSPTMISIFSGKFSRVRERISVCSSETICSFSRKDGWSCCVPTSTAYTFFAPYSRST